MKEFLSRLGRAKYKLIRVIAYIQFLNLAILIDLNGVKWWYALFVPIVLFLYWFENNYGIKGELDVAWGNSREWQEYKKEFNELKERLK